MSKGGATRASPPGMISSLWQLSSAPPRRPHLPQETSWNVCACASAWPQDRMRLWESAEIVLARSLGGSGR